MEIINKLKEIITNNLKEEKMAEKEMINIVALMQNNPLTKLTSDYGSKIIQKIRERFSPEEQQLYVANLYCYLNYNSKTDFVVNLDRTWKWLGYNRINDCSRVLLKNFKENVDYKIEKAALQDGKAGPNLLEEGKNLGGAGLNRECITLTVNCFKKLCLKSRTEKADQIHDYYIELENIFNEVVSEQTEELQQKLLLKDKQKEQNLITNFGKKPILYVGIAEYCEDGTFIIKPGYTDNMQTRLNDHKNEINPNFTFEYVYETVYNREVERRLYRSQEMVKRRLKKVYPGRKEAQTELFKLDKTFTLQDLDKLIKEIKGKIESGDRDDLIDEINKLELENTKLKFELSKNDSTRFDEIRNEYNILKTENNTLNFKIEQLEEKLKNTTTVINESNVETIHIQLNSMEDLNINLHKIKKAVCYNFLVDFIVKNINEKEVKLSVHEIFELYSAFRKANRYEDPIYEEKYENSLITKAFNDVDGIKNTYKTMDKIQSRAKIFYIDKITHWICENVQVPKRFRSIFREISKQVIFTDTYCEILNKEIDFNHSSSYSYLIYLITKYKNTEPVLILKNTIITEEYLKFMLRFENKKLTVDALSKILLEIPGITKKQRINDGDKQYVRGLSINLSDVIDWINNTLEISSNSLIASTIRP